VGTTVDEVVTIHGTSWEVVITLHDDRVVTLGKQGAIPGCSCSHGYSNTAAPEILPPTAKIQPDVRIVAGSLAT
jgi:hypothetical protein